MSLSSFDQEMIQTGLFNSMCALQSMHNPMGASIILSFEQDVQNFCECPREVLPTVNTDVSPFFIQPPFRKALHRETKATRIDRMNFQQEFVSLVNSIAQFHDPEQVLFSGNKKGKNRANASSKRSNFIGVCKNGPNLQALISINKKKTYIGTFMTEQEAAEAYDYFSMLINGTRAKTNFRYTKREAEELISRMSYLSNL